MYDCLKEKYLCNSLSCKLKLASSKLARTPTSLKREDKRQTMVIQT